MRLRMIKQRMILVTSRDDGARDDEVVEAAKEEDGAVVFLD